ncbi:MAG: HAD family hydrolase [Candidatus Enteromonas sp.]|nr:HAD family hydrolase [Candidatus Enteromonas sp.]
MKHPLIFDLDGTLWDSSKSVAEAWTMTGKRILGQDFCITQEQVRAEMGKTMTEIVKDIAPGLSEKERLSFAKILLEEENEYLMDHPGEIREDLLPALRHLAEGGRELYIVSNCQSGYIETFLHALGEDAKLFTDFLCWGDTHQEKNVTIQYLMIRHNILDAIYIGDTKGDEFETRKAGLLFIHAAYGFGEAVAPDAVIDSPKDIPVALFQMAPLIAQRLKARDSIRSTVFTVQQVEKLQEEFFAMHPGSDYAAYLRKARRLARKNGCCDEAFYRIVNMAIDATLAYDIREICPTGPRAGIFAIFLQTWVLFLLFTHIVPMDKAANIDEVFGTDGGIVEFPKGAFNEA